MQCGLSCFKSSGRFSRHTEINSIISRSLTSIHVNSTLVPNGLPRDDGKRPGGMTLVPWIKGQPLVWDVTVVRGDQEGLFKLVTLDRILNRITVTSGCWWLVVVNAIPISIICQINQQNISSCSVINNQIKFFFQLYCQLKQSLITRYYSPFF
jgi:hypothetical protein